MSTEPTPSVQNMQLSEELFGSLLLDQDTKFGGPDEQATSKEARIYQEV